MKKLLTGILLALSISVAPAHADNRGAICMKLYELAATIMEARQVGVTLPDMVNASGDDPFTMDVIKNAFKVSRYNGEDYQQKAIDRFAEKYYIACIEGKARRGD